MYTHISVAVVLSVRGRTRNGGNITCCFVSNQKRRETEGERVIEMKESESDRGKERKHVNAHEALE